MNINQFINPQQLRFIKELTRGEEGAYFIAKLKEIQKVIDKMPKTYDTEEMGLSAPVSLHYFSGGSDWWIIERDCEEEQLQAFGYVCLNGDTEYAELGYVSIVELLECGVELDLHWSVQTLGQVKARVRGQGI